MGIQQGLCSINPVYLLAAWKNDPQHPPAGDHFGYGVEDQISYAQFYYPATSERWTVIGTMPANTSIGPALVCDQNLSPSGPGPSVYAVWKGETIDTRLFFSRLTLPFNIESLPSDPESQSWQGGQIPGATSSSSPSIAFVGSVGFGASIVTVWSGTGNGQGGHKGDNTLWYSVTPVPNDPGYVTSFAAPAASNQVPGAASSSGAAVTVDTEGRLWVVWLDLGTKQWQYIFGTVSGTSIAWGAASELSNPNPPNWAGYSLGQAASLGSQGDPNGVYFGWSDAQSKVWVTGSQNLISGLPTAPTAIPSVSTQATSNSGCALASLPQQDPFGSATVRTFLYAMWADTSGQLHYASTTDGENWQDSGNLADATTAPDIPEFRFPIHLPFVPGVKFP